MPARTTDHRPVTVLFADLTGFTALSERLDPEDVRAFQNDMFRMMAEEIQRLDGSVEKFVGDAVMTVFGVPVAHEDDPERALRAGLALLERMRTLSRQWEPCFGGPVTLHIGVNTGPVVAGSLGTPAGEAYAVTGDTVNTASRLLAAAPPGTIVVSESTYRPAQQRFAFEPLGDLALKGKADAVGAYRVLGVLAGPRTSRGLEALGGWAAATDHPAQARLLRKVGALRWDAGEREAADARCRAQVPGGPGAHRACARLPGARADGVSQGR